MCMKVIFHTHFSKLSPPDLTIIFYWQVRGRGAPSEVVQIYWIFPAKLPQTDPAIIFYCHIRTWEFFKIVTNQSCNFSKLAGPEAGDFLKLPLTDPAIIFYWQVAMTINNIHDDKYRIIKAHGGVDGRFTVN